MCQLNHFLLFTLCSLTDCLWFSMSVSSLTFLTHSSFHFFHYGFFWLFSILLSFYGSGLGRSGFDLLMDGLSFQDRSWSFSFWLFWFFSSTSRGYDYSLLVRLGFTYRCKVGVHQLVLIFLAYWLFWLGFAHFLGLCALTCYSFWVSRVSYQSCFFFFTFCGAFVFGCFMFFPFHPSISLKLGFFLLLKRGF